MTVSDRVNTEQWDANSVVLIQSRLAKIHRNMVLKRSRLHDLLTDQNKKILDLGCGSGPFLRYFAERGFKNLYAVEPDADLVRGIPTDLAVEIRNCRAERIEFDDEMFDAVFVYGVLHHLKGVQAYQETCREIGRVLKPGGIVFVMEPACYWVFRVVEVGSKLLGVFSRTFKAFSECLEEEKTEQHFFIRNHQIVKDALMRNGFQPIVDRYFLYSWIFTASKGGE